MFAEIAFDIPLDRLFTYAIPDDLEAVLMPGHRVLAPFGKKKITGYVVRMTPESKIDKCFSLTSLLDPQPLLSEELIKLGIWISEYYMTPLGRALHNMVPPGLDRHSEKVYFLKQDIDEFEIRALQKTKPVQSKILKTLFLHKKLALRKLIKKAGGKNFVKNLDELLRLGVVAEQDTLSAQSASIRYEKFVRLSDVILSEPERLENIIATIPKNAKKQIQILDYLEKNTDFENPEPFRIRQSEILRICDAPYSAVSGLAEKNFVTLEDVEKFRDPYDMEIFSPKKLTLNPEQHVAVEAIKKNHGEFKTFLLYGVTGSGKTQVYIESIRPLVDEGKSAIVLVPEIALTPQMVERFKAVFGDTIAVLHSRMTIGERFDAWRKLYSGEFKIAIGARSAILAPVQNLGIVIVDEEHETTYKQNEPSPKYHARDVAIVRAKMAGALVVLGSATPSLESFYNAKNGKYELLELRHRVFRTPLPEVEIVNMREERERHTDGWEPVLSQPLREHMKRVIKRGEQVILFQNRRGYASVVECYECGYLAQCPNCSITLTYHLPHQKMLCHYCGHRVPLIDECPKCRNVNILHQGVGTQKVEEKLKAFFPDVKVLRMDHDTTHQKGSHIKILEQFRNGEASILLGTQMVTKGLDFEKVSLVGVISADTNLHLPDFRATERNFQMLTQVAGRAGRKKKIGHVVIQTYNPQHASVAFARTHDYDSFYEQEIHRREELLYPPASRLVLIQFKNEEENKAVEQSARFSDILRRRVHGNSIMILGPAPAPIAKIRNQFRWHILIKADKKFDPGGSFIRGLLKKTLEEMNLTQGEFVSIEIDPVNLL